MTEIEQIERIKDEKISKFRQARFSEDYSFILDSNNDRVDLNDPRIVYISPEPRDSYGRRLVKELFKKYKKNIRISKETDASTMQYAKNICSGRECLPSFAIVGAVLKDINEYRDENEISIYRIPLDQHGPCQNGAWPVLWKTFAKRLNLNNAIFGVFPKYTNKFLGLNSNLIAWENIYFILGEYINEAKNALQCVAESKSEALEKFEELTNNLLENIGEGKKTLNTSLLKWARELSKIPLKSTVEKTPKVLIFGGLNLMFDHYPVEEFFLERGIIPKVVDTVEAMSLILAESTIRFGFKKGFITPKEQFNEEILKIDGLNETEQKEVIRVKRNKNNFKFLISQLNMFRKLMRKSNLLFDPFIDIIDLFNEGHKYVTLNSCTETPLIAGRFLYSVKEGIYDGLINLGTFNCQPAMNSQAIIRPLANKSEIPYAAIDCEGPWISTNQRRLLETIAIQARRLRNEKNSNSIKAI